jgi:2-amino-4-hydroxy-6-hydroxymethyldihydropteridine diphosphokinase
MSRVYLALGSNVGNKLAYIQKAIQLLGTSISDIKEAPLYASEAMGYTDQADFLNTAISGQTVLSPEALLAFNHGVEQEVGRTPSFKWGPRQIDIDIIFYDNLIKTTAKLTLPHPLFRERDFVLKPLLDLSPELEDPLTRQPLSKLLNELGDHQRSDLKLVDR